jgi:uncharacterized protein (DUF4415 family)
MAKSSSARATRVGRKRQRMTSSPDIDLSDIPEASPAQLRVMRRVGRPPLGRFARQMIAIRIDPQVLSDIKQEARRQAVAYQTLINDILADHTRLRRSKR